MRKVVVPTEGIICPAFTCQNSHRVNIRGFALIGCHAGGGIAFDMLDRMISFAHRKLDIAGGNIILEINKGLATLPCWQAVWNFPNWQLGAYLIFEAVISGRDISSAWLAIALIALLAAAIPSFAPRSGSKLPLQAPTDCSASCVADGQKQWVRSSHFNLPLALGMKMHNRV